MKKALNMALFVVILVSFGSGVCGMVLDRCPIILKIHRGISIVLVFFLAIHIFVFHKKCMSSKRN